MFQHRRSTSTTPQQNKGDALEWLILSIRESKTLEQVNENMDCASDSRLDYILDLVLHFYTFARLH